VRNYSGYLIAENEVAIKISYAYMSIVDEAITKCMVVSQSAEHVLGFVGVGKIVGVGFGVSNVREGDRVIVYADHNGVAETIHTANKDSVIVFNAKEFNDLEALIIATLSVSRHLLDTVKGANVLIVGNDLSIVPFAYVSQLNASKVYIVPSHTLWHDIIKGEHVSIYDEKPICDIVILSTYDPIILSLVSRIAKKEFTLIIHPGLMSLLKIFGYNLSNVLIKPIRFGDIGSGISIYKELKDSITHRMRLLSAFDYIERRVHPSVVNMQNL